jgi:(1->4)-alpha-D-glucan 1-alpha-D-glucosylmutase
VLKLTSPGVPDFYQGTELWNLSLVDPDNRRPVDYQLRSQLLNDMRLLEVAEGPLAVCENVLANLPDGRIKLWVSHKTLLLRSRWHSVFRKGAYQSLDIVGDYSTRAIAFLRHDGGRSVLTVVPRFAYTLMRGKQEFPLAAAWGNTAVSLPVEEVHQFKNIFTGERIEVSDVNSVLLSDLFAKFPVAVLAGEIQ